MESFRLKNIIILILALMNLCLLGLLGVRLTTGYSAQAEARQQMVQLFAAEGVSLDDGIIPGATPPAGLTLSRDPDEDEKLAGFLLGDELVMSDGGGGVTTYQSENGSAVFRSDGTFDVVIEQSGETADALCRAFCRAFHYEALAFSLDGEDGSASAVQTYDGAPVVNCTVSFSISGGGGLRQRYPPAPGGTDRQWERCPVRSGCPQCLPRHRSERRGGHCRDGPVPLL